MWPFTTKKVQQTDKVPAECILNTLVAELNVRNVDNWKRDKTSLYYESVKSRITGLTISFCNYRESAVIEGVYSDIFTEEQAQKLWMAAVSMSDALKRKENKKLLQKEIGMLQRWFPKCFN